MNYIQGTPSRSGPEADLVQRFVETGLLDSGNTESRSIFIEPRIGSSRPDVVAVYWDTSITENWPMARLSLSKFDLRLAHLLFLEGPCSEQDLQDAFPERLKRSLRRLEHARVVYHSDGLWQTRELDQIFAVRRIITVEAKLSAMARALQQAYINTWFASESYVLTPAKEPRPRTLRTAAARGVGIWIFCEENELLSPVCARTRCIPQSYGSWLLNELVWRTRLEGAP